MVFRGAQSGQEVTTQLAPEYELAGTTLEPISEEEEVQVSLRFGDELAILVSISEPLEAGNHQATLVLPTELTSGRNTTVDDVTIIITYTVPPAIDDQLLVFCKQAPPLTDGRRPTTEDLDALGLLVGDYLEEPDRQTLTFEIMALRADLVAFEAGRGTRFQTEDVNTILGRLCNIEMTSESVES